MLQVTKLTIHYSLLHNNIGTTLYYQPGLIEGGSIQHECNPQRSIGYYIEPLLLLAPFSKYPFKLTLTGVTHGPDDPSVIILLCYYSIRYARLITTDTVAYRF